VDMWEPFRKILAQWVPQCKIVCDKFHVLQHANDAIDEVRRAEFFRHGTQKRGLIKGKKWLLLSRWKNLTYTHRGELNRLFGMNRRVFKAFPPVFPATEEPLLALRRLSRVNRVHIDRGG